MNNSLLTVRTDANLKTQAQKTARSLGFSLSSLVNAYLKNLVKTKTVHFEENLIPTPYLEKLIKSAENDRKEGKQYSFTDGKSAIKFLDSMIESK